jgi:hypothetical protein
MTASVAVFCLASAFPVGSIGCLHNATMQFGLPFPWLGVEVRYGGPSWTSGLAVHGPIDRIAGLQIDWTMLAFQVVAALAIGAAFVGSMKVIRMAAGGGT